MISVDLDKEYDRLTYQFLREGAVIHVHIRGKECIAVTRKCHHLVCSECFLWPKNFPKADHYPCYRLGSLGLVTVEDTVE